MAPVASVLALASLFAVRAQNPPFEQKVVYLKTTLSNIVPTDSASLDCLVPEADRPSFMERLNKEANQSTDVFKQTELFGKSVTFDRFVKGVMEGKSQHFSDMKEFNDALLREKLTQRQKLPKDSTEMSCLVAPADRTSFAAQMTKFAENKQVVSVDDLAAKPSPSYDKFITDMVTTMSHDEVAGALKSDAKETVTMEKVIEQAPAVDEAQDVAAQAAATAQSYATSAPKKTWHWSYYLLIGLAVCCICPCIGLACSAFLCYESVAWIFGGDDDKPQKKKKRTSRAVDLTSARAAPAPAPVMAATSAPVTLATAPMLAPAMVQYQTPVPLQYQAPVPTVATAAVQYQVAPSFIQSGTVANAQPLTYQTPVQMAVPSSY